MESEIYLNNNRIGRLYNSISRMNELGKNTTTRIVWFRYSFKEYENADQPIPELEPLMFIAFGNFLNEITTCRDIVRGFENYPQRLYENTFSQIYAIMRNSWDNIGHPWKVFADQLDPHLTNLDHISNKASAVSGEPKVPTPEDVENLLNEINEFEIRINSEITNSDLRSRLQKCIGHARRSLNNYLMTAENDFWEAFEEIWKDLIFYIIKGKTGTQEERKEEVKNSGIEKMLSRMNLFASIINVGNQLLSYDNITNVLSYLQ